MMILVPLIAFLCSSPVPSDEPFQSMEFPEALALAGTKEKVVMIDFFTTWCVPCKKLDAVTWKDEAVKRWLAEHTVALKIDAEKEVELAKRYGVDSYPNMVFIQPDGALLGRIVGYRDPKAFLAEAEDALKGIRRSQRLREELEAQGWTDPSLRQKLGDELVREREYEAALEEYLWCFDHGVEHMPHYHGVRLSFLLNNIARLGQKYPPAVKALRARRDAAKAKLLGAGATDLTARDFASINRVLDEASITLEVWEQLSQAWIEAGMSAGDAGERIRRTLFDEVVDLLLKQKRYEEILRGVGDADAVVEQNIQRLDALTEALDEAALGYMRRKLVVDGCKLYEALLGVPGHAEKAARVAERLLELDASANTYKLLVRHATRAGAEEVAQGLIEEALRALPEKEHKKIRAAARKKAD